MKVYSLVLLLNLCCALLINRLLWPHEGSGLGCSSHPHPLFFSVCSSLLPSPVLFLFVARGWIDDRHVRRLACAGRTRGLDSAVARATAFSDHFRAGVYRSLDRLPVSVLGEFGVDKLHMGKGRCQGKGCFDVYVDFVIQKSFVLRTLTAQSV